MGIIDISIDDVIEAYEDADSEGKSTLPCHIIQTFCEIHKRKETLKFALVEFGKYQRYDIRNWYDNESKPGKGIALTKEELDKLYLALKDRNIAEYNDDIRARYKSDKVEAIIYERICLFSDYTKKDVKWHKELSIIDWGYGSKFDFRRWTEDYSKCGKGITIPFDNMKTICDSLKELYSD